MTTFELDRQYIAGTYKRFPVEIVSGSGSLVKDVNGKEYIDMGSGIAVTSFGVADSEWIAAVDKQIHAVQHYIRSGKANRLREPSAEADYQRLSGSLRYLLKKHGLYLEEKK